MGHPQSTGTHTPFAPIGSAEQTSVTALLKALGDPIRMDVVQALAGGERCVCELTSSLGLAQSRLSFHLKVMRQAGLISAREEGRWVYYRLEPGALGHLSRWLEALENLSQAPANRCG
jgi:ArsR family transcriptional regulator